MPAVAEPVLERELKTYEKHRAELLGQAEGQWVLIHESDVLGTFETQSDAINQGYRTLGNVPFLVKQIVLVEVPETLSSIAV